MVNDRSKDVPRPDKIAIAKQKHEEKRKEVENLFSSNDPDMEKKAMNLLVEMMRLKTEEEVLERVHKHQTQGENLP